jgi:hypothetical protein
MGPQEYKLDVPTYVVPQFIHKVYSYSLMCCVLSQ